MENWDKVKEENEGYLRINFKAPKGEKQKEKFPEARGVKVSVNLEKQSKLIRDICMLDDALLTSGRYDERDILDAKDCIENDGLRVKLCKFLDKYMEGMTGTTGYAAMETVNRNPGDETKLQEIAIDWVFDSTPVKRVIVRDTRPLAERLVDCVTHEDKIALVVKEMKTTSEKAEQILPILEG